MLVSPFYLLCTTTCFLYKTHAIPSPTMVIAVTMAANVITTTMIVTVVPTKKQIKAFVLANRLYKYSNSKCKWGSQKLARDTSAAK